jgi:hypothetical protein
MEPNLIKFTLSKISKENHDLQKIRVLIPALLFSTFCPSFPPDSVMQMPQARQF